MCYGKPGLKKVPTPNRWTRKLGHLTRIDISPGPKKINWKCLGHLMSEAHSCPHFTLAEHLDTLSKNLAKSQSLVGRMWRSSRWHLDHNHESLKGLGIKVKTLTKPGRISLILSTLTLSYLFDFPFPLRSFYWFLHLRGNSSKNPSGPFHAGIVTTVQGGVYRDLSLEHLVTQHFLRNIMTISVLLLTTTIVECTFYRSTSSPLCPQYPNDFRRK